jgi:hypothetical protein
MSHNGPGYVGDRNDPAGEFLALLLEAANEFKRSDHEEEADDDSRPTEPWLERRRLEHGHPDQHTPTSREEVAEAFSDSDSEVAVDDSKTA